MKTKLFAILLLLLSSINYAQTWGNVGAGLGGNVYDLIKFDDKLYACGGTFDVKYWDGSTWTSLPYAYGMAYPLTMAIYNNELYIGGDVPFTGTISHVYKYNGTSWVQVGGDFNASWTSGTKALLTYNGQLISGGHFETIGGASIKNIATWDGASWSDLGDGLNALVWKLAEHDGLLFASGAFTASGADTTVRYLAKWDGIDWSPIDTTFSFNDAPGAMISFNDQLIIGNVWDTISGIPMKGIASWDGVNFTSMGNDLIDQTSNFWVYNNKLYVAARIYTLNPFTTASVVLKWNGYYWEQIGEYFDDSILTIDDFQGELYCGGAFDEFQTHIAKTDPMAGIEPVNSQTKISIYPNPASEQINFSSAETGTLTITDEFGKTVLKMEISEQNTQIDVSAFSTGMYVLIFISENETITQKLMVH